MARFYIPVEIERRVRKDAQNRCGYCLSPQRLVMARLEIEHIIPIANEKIPVNPEFFQETENLLTLKNPFPATKLKEITTTNNSQLPHFLTLEQ